jgi:glycosyltransferase involved in cell wall biosynthesis
MAISVVYDAAVLGEALRHNLSRTGVCRVVDYVARTLAVHPDCDLYFCSSGGTSSVMDCQRYLEAVSKISDARFVARRQSQRVQDISAILPLDSLKRSVRPFSSVGYRVGSAMERWFERQQAAEIQNASIYHSPFDPFPDSITSKPGAPARFMTVYDMIPKIHPEWFNTRTGNKIAPRFQTILDSLRPDDYVHCISESTRNDLCNILRHLDPARVFVSPLAADNEVFHANSTAAQIDAVRHKYKIPEGRYLLSVCTLEPRKNISAVVQAFGRVVAQERLNDVSLVLVGVKGWDTETLDKALADPKAHRDRVIVTGFVADEELAPLYSGATVFIYPSLYEGFGLPPLEAMACGVPVITSNTSSIPEVVGDAGLMVAPTDIDALCQSILSIIEDSALRQSLSRRSLEQAATFSWSRCADSIVAAYERAVGRAGV